MTIDQHIDAYVARESDNSTQPEVWTEEPPNRHRMWQWITRMRMHSLRAAQRREHTEEFKNAEFALMMRSRLLRP
ncbi:hypothetical protein [Natronoglycomyces albus]|uniref:Uncharacterized protein n=1 Tax=Natronoglycomyces albus TaxID=2811108 RepID=A0A895XV08_9ACTN|nr:hypothetical protein [Natronoglycomyces albus]QSB06060.1 hypothetical protein JQS30_03830 [Natronoglycomyces albus]